MVDRSKLEKELETLLDYHFNDHHLLEELLQAAGSSVSDPTVHGDQHGNKCLALLSNSVLSTVLLEQWYESSQSTGKLLLNNLSQELRLTFNRGWEPLIKDACKQ